MKIKEAYTRWSSTYDSDRNLTRDLDQDATRQALAGRRYHSVLELGCGTGKNTLFLAGISNQILALDLSPGMLKRAKTKIESEHVSFALADLTKPWPCRAGSFDLVVINLVLEHIENLGHIFSEVSQALTTGGLFFVSELHPYRQYQGILANFQSEQETIEIQAFVHHLSDFIHAATQNNLLLRDIKEWWHDHDQKKLPRLISFKFEKGNQERGL